MTTTLQDLKPAQIKPHRNNPRRDVGDVTELAASIAEQGIVEPLIVAPNGTGDTYVLLAGHRRLAAAKTAKCKTVPCLVRTDLTDPKAQLELMLVENLQRTDLSPIEEAEAYQQLLEFPGYTQAKIAKTTGRAIATVRSRLKLAKLPKSALAKIHAGQISLGEATVLTEFAGDKTAYAHLERTAGTAAFAHAVDEARRSAKLARSRELALKKLRAADVRIIDDPGYGTARLMLLHDDAAVEEHRDCPGFAAYVRSAGYYATTVQVVYVCDQPRLHATASVDDDDGTASRAAARAAVAEQLDADAAVRRAWIRDEVLGDPSDGLALDILRQHAHRRLKGYDVATDVVADVLGADRDDAKAIAAAIDRLDWRALAVLFDVMDHTSDENYLRRVDGWDGSSYYDAKAWRARLTTLYGYTWTEHEQQMLDDAAAKTAAAAAREVDAGDDQDEDDFVYDDVAEVDE